MTDTSPGASHRSLAPRTPGTPPGRRKLTLVGGQPVRNCRTVGAERGEPGSTPTPARPPVTPLADAVARLRQESVASFHALPWSGGKALRDSASRQQYVDLFGDDFWNADVSYSGPVLDSFFRPVGPLDHAQHEAAEAFGATYTFFLTAGTTLANQVALDAVAGPHSRVLGGPNHADGASRARPVPDGGGGGARGRAAAPAVPAHRWPPSRPGGGAPMPPALRSGPASVLRDHRDRPEHDRHSRAPGGRPAQRRPADAGHQPARARRADRTAHAAGNGRPGGDRQLHELRRVRRPGGVDRRPGRSGVRRHRRLRLPRRGRSAVPDRPVRPDRRRDRPCRRDRRRGSAA